uniref:Uncharacterized protein n=1 Tax=Oryza barthii TaxID=65489 RepID=A0A0D3H734_9ORYZ
MYLPDLWTHGRSNASLRRRAPRQGGSERGGARSPFDWECGNPRWRLVTRSPWLRPRLRLMEVASRERIQMTIQPAQCKVDTERETSGCKLKNLALITIYDVRITNAIQNLKPKSSTAIEMLVLASLPTNDPRSRITPTWNSSAPGSFVAFRATAHEWAKSISKRMAPGGAFSITGLPAENLRRLYRLCKTTMVKNSRSLSCPGSTPHGSEFSKI